MSIVDQILDFFLSPAHADTLGVSAQPQTGGGYPLLIMIAVFVIFMYVGIWRPQSKRAKEQRDLVSSLAKGDEVLTAGGILGRIVKVADNHVVLAVSDTAEIIVQKGSIVNALPKGTIKSIF